MTRALLFCLGMMEMIRRGGDSSGLNSNWRTTTNCEGCHDFIWSPIWEFLDCTGSLSSLLSNGSIITSISVWSWMQSSFFTETFSDHGAVSPYFDPVGHISSCPTRTRPRVGGDPDRPPTFYTPQSPSA